MNASRRTPSRPPEKHLVLPSKAARLEPIETGLAILGLVVMMSTIRSLLLGATDDANEAGSIINQVVTLGMSGIAIGLMAVMGTKTWVKDLLIRSWPLVVFIMLALASVAWSMDKPATIRRDLALLLSTGFTLFLVARFGFEEILRIFFVVFAIFVILGYLAVPVPGQGITPNGILVGTWRGFTGQKNEFGRVCGIILGMGIIGIALDLKPGRRLWLPLVAAVLPLLVMSGSKTPVAAVAVALAATVFIHAVATGRIGRVRMTTGLSALVAAVCVILSLLTLIVGLPMLLDLLGRDLTFSGRLSLWEYVVSRSSDRWILGAGFRAFWSEVNRAFYFEHFWWRADGDNRAPFHSHSGLLDVYSELGAVGLAVLLTFLASCIRTSLRAFRRGFTRPGAIFCFIVFFVLVFSVTERSYLQYFDPIWFAISFWYLMAKRALLLDECETAAPPAQAERSE